MKKLLYVTVLLVAFLFALSFHLNNPQTVTLNYYMGWQRELPLSILMLVALVIGIVIGWFAGLIRSLKLRRRLAQANRSVETLKTRST